MIILSQDRRMLINFDNTKSINILRNEIYIYDSLNDSGTYIAKYKTEERAKEVLQEIAENYRRVYTSYQQGRSDYPIETLIFDRSVYKMPLE